MNDEQKALLSVAGRQDAGSIKKAQAAERKRLRAGAKAQREELVAELKREKAALRAAAQKRAFQSDCAIERVKNTLRRALEQSDKDVVERFRETRVTQLNCGVLGIAIAQKRCSTVTTTSPPGKPSGSQAQIIGY